MKVTSVVSPVLLVVELNQKSPNQRERGKVMTRKVMKATKVIEKSVSVSHAVKYKRLAALK